MYQSPAFAFGSVSQWSAGLLLLLLIAGLSVGPYLMGRFMAWRFPGIGKFCWVVGRGASWLVFTACVFFSAQELERMGSTQVFDAVHTESGTCLIVGTYEGLTEPWQYGLVYFPSSGGALEYYFGHDESYWADLRFSGEAQPGSLVVLRGDQALVTLDEASKTMGHHCLLGAPTQSGSPMRASGSHWTQAYLRQN